jgi:hypothetical protein
MKVLTLCWDPEIGEGYANLDKINEKLFGIEKTDFLDDVINMLIETRENVNWVDDYKKILENEET